MTDPKPRSNAEVVMGAIEIGHEAARLNAVLQAQISDVRREVARMVLRAEDE